MNSFLILSIFISSISFQSAKASSAPVKSEIYKYFAHTLGVGEVLKDCHIEVVRESISSGHFGLVETDKSENVNPFSNCDYKVRIASQLQTMESKLTLIHELIHVIRHQYNPHEVVWLDEGIAQFVEANYILLYPIDKNKRLNESKEIHLSSNFFDYKPHSQAYSISYFFIKYLYSRFGGVDFLREVIKSPYSGWENIEKSLLQLKAKKRISVPDQFLNRQALWTHFIFAIVLNTNNHADYGLFSIDSKFKNYSAHKVNEWSDEMASSLIEKKSEAKALVLEIEDKQKLTEVLKSMTSENFKNLTIYAVQNHKEFKAIKINSAEDTHTLNSAEPCILILMSKF